MTPEEKALADKAAAEAAAKTAADANEARMKDLEFRALFSEATADIPVAKEFRDQIKEKWAAGMEIGDATVVVLNKNGKLPSKDIETPAGTSAPTVSTQKKEPVTAEEWATQFQELERKGEIRLDA